MNNERHNVENEPLGVEDARADYQASVVRSPSVPPGYKQAEVALIPEEWSTMRLGDIANIKTGSRNNEGKVEDGELPFFVRSSKVERTTPTLSIGKQFLFPAREAWGAFFITLMDALTSTSVFIGSVASTKTCLASTSTLAW